MGVYWLNNNKQGGDGWKSSRRNGWGHAGDLLTASNFGTAAGHDTFQTAEELALEMAGAKVRVVTPESRVHMDRGTNNEPLIRKCYEAIQGVVVTEVGLAIPKFDIRIGASLDGMVGRDGTVEIKCPAKMYPKLVDPKYKDYHPSLRIPQTHYDQMIGGMAITGKSWCDYAVCDLQAKHLYIERVLFDTEYWSVELYPKLRTFIEHLLPSVSK
jgi:hypothetical protein